MPCGGHSCFLLSLASDVPVLPALREQHLELKLFTVKDERTGISL